MNKLRTGTCTLTSRFHQLRRYMQGEANTFDHDFVNEYVSPMGLFIMEKRYQTRTASVSRPGQNDRAQEVIYRYSGQMHMHL